MNINIDLGESEQSKFFFNRYPTFYAAFERLITLSNRCFGRSLVPKNRTQDVCFDLGHTCRSDFVELAFLAIHGFGIGAIKLLRGLYERTVTLAYIVKYPEKAERFVRFAAIQEYKALVAALKVVSEEHFDAEIGSTNAAEIRRLREEVKHEFETKLCDCGRKGIAITWDIDFTSMALKVGDPYDKLYVPCYIIPNFHVHATAASIIHVHDADIRDFQNQRNAESALLNGATMLMLAAQSQNILFNLDLEAEIRMCDEVFAAAFSAGEDKKTSAPQSIR